MAVADHGLAARRGSEASQGPRLAPASASPRRRPRRRPGQAHVLGDRGAEDVRVVVDQPDAGPEVGWPQAAGVAAVDQQRAADRVQEPHQQRGHGRLAAARGADDPDPAAGRARSSSCTATRVARPSRRATSRSQPGVVELRGRSAGSRRRRLLAGQGVQPRAPRPGCGTETLRRPRRVATARRAGRAAAGPAARHRAREGTAPEHGESAMPRRHPAPQATVVSGRGPRRWPGPSAGRRAPSAAAAREPVQRAAVGLPQLELPLAGQDVPPPGGQRRREPPRTRARRPATRRRVTRWADQPRRRRRRTTRPATGRRSAASAKASTPTRPRWRAAAAPGAARRPGRRRRRRPR